MMRYIKRLERKDISAHAFDDSAWFVHYEIERCRRNASTVWFEFLNLHPFAPQEQAKGYQELIKICRLIWLK